MKLFIASDHGGFELKNKLIEFIKSNFEHQIEDLGPYQLDPSDDYPIFATKLAKEILNNQGSIGILICKTGVGMSIVANRYNGIFAVLATTVEHAKRAREHENANVICLDSEFISEDLNQEMVSTFLTTNFSNEERHLRRIDQINKI